MNQKEKKGQFGTGFGSVAAFIAGGNWEEKILAPGDDTSGLRAGVGSHGCSCLANCDCGVACMHPDRGPGSPGRGPAALGCVVRQRTCGCVPCVPARCGNFRPMSSDCVVRSG